MSGRACVSAMVSARNEAPRTSGQRTGNGHGVLLRCTLLACVCGRRSASPALQCGAQVRHVCGGERGYAQAAHMLRVPPGALLRAALSAGGLGRPPRSV